MNERDCNAATKVMWEDRAHTRQISSSLNTVRCFWSSIVFRIYSNFLMRIVLNSRSRLDANGLARISQKSHAFYSHRIDSIVLSLLCVVFSFFLLLLLSRFSLMFSSLEIFFLSLLSRGNFSLFFFICFFRFIYCFLCFACLVSSADALANSKLIRRRISTACAAIVYCSHVSIDTQRATSDSWWDKRDQFVVAVAHRPSPSSHCVKCCELLRSIYKHLIYANWIDFVYFLCVCMLSELYQLTVSVSVGRFYDWHPLCRADSMHPPNVQYPNDLDPNCVGQLLNHRLFLRLLTMVTTMMTLPLLLLWLRPQLKSLQQLLLPLEQQPPYYDS